jgi:signal transduction histidine kinase
LKSIFLALLAPIFLISPTSFNLSGFNITTCDAFEFEWFPFTLYAASLGALAMIWIFILFIRRYRRSDSDFKKQLSLMVSGIESFLFLFFIWTTFAYYLSEINVLPNSQLEMYGMFGIVAFIIYIGILMVRFKTFNTKTFAAQALVFALIALVGSQFFYVTDLPSIIVTSATLIVTGVIGIYLVRSVKSEIHQRELIQKQEKDLEIANAQQVTLLHFISHEIKGYLTKSEAGFAAISQGDFGVVSPELASMANGALNDVRKGVRTVMDILDASNMKQGTVAYKNSVFDLKDAVKGVVDHLMPAINEKHLTVNMSFAWEIPCKVNGDEEKIRDHVIRNLVDNAIKYTPAGSITVEVVRVGSVVRFSVQDSGVGITDEDKAHLFTEGGHGKDSVKINVHSTGYGLYIAKQVVEASGGKIWAESDGAGKGSRFIVELPAA